MQGFTDKALILGPDPGLCDGRPAQWKRHFQESVEAILNYCKYNNIDVYYLATDEMIYPLRSMYMTGAKGILTLGSGDMHFLAVRNSVFSKYESRTWDTSYRELVKKSMETFPVDPDNKSEDARITLVIKREAKVAREIIKNFNLVFNIQYKNKQQYKAVTKAGDCRAVVSVDAKTFLCSVQMSGQVLSPIDVLEIGNANQPVYSWEVPKII